MSQHISTAGTEASGTSNMKFIMNGSMIIGTMDGANVEIAEEVGRENMFVFGANVEEINKYRALDISARASQIDGRLKAVFRHIFEGKFGPLNDDIRNYISRLQEGNDHYAVCRDFGSYLQAQEKADLTFRDEMEWARIAIYNVARSAKFSSDRTIQEYCSQIWKIGPNRIPDPASDPNKRVRSFPNLIEAGKR
jgi:glycogen phosphorylase